MELDYKEFIKGEDLKVLDISLEQDVNLCLLSAKGDWKQYPHIGADVESYTDSTTANFEIRSDVKTELKRAFPDIDFKVETDADKSVVVSRDI